MAKSNVPGLDRLRDLFTSAERAVLESSAGKTLIEASRQQLDQTLAKARALRDKWRDLHATQSRATKRSKAGTTTTANTRSREKTDMFTAAIERVQSRLAELGFRPAAGRLAPKTLSSAARRAGHRTTRAGVKDALAAQAAEMNQKSRAKKPAVRTAAAVAPAAPPRAAKRAVSKKRRPAKTVAARAKTGGQPLRLDAAQQRSAQTSAKAARLALDANVARRGRHVQAVGKRRQAARDRRGR